MDTNLPDFQNTQIAFASKSDSDLRQSYVLFKLLAYPKLVKLGAWLAPWALNMGFKGLIRKTIFKQFVGGEHIKACSDTVSHLHKYAIGSILDYSVEGKAEESVFNATAKEIMASIDNASANPAIPFSVFKVTGIASMELLEAVSNSKALSADERLAWERVCLRVEQICDLAYNKQQKLFIDAEESWIQDAIDKLALIHMERLNREHIWIFNTYQLYRHDRLNVLQQHYQYAREKSFKIGAKLVRGAYMEKERARAKTNGYPDPIQISKAKTDYDYNTAVQFCVNHIESVGLCASTHNEESCLDLTKILQNKG